MRQLCIKGTGISLQEKVDRAIEVLRENEPPEGYYLAFSGGKDSLVCKELLRMAGVRFEGRYNNTTIDPPELVRYIKRHHPDVSWNNPNLNLFHRVATRIGTPPTRAGRWCCDEYKECSAPDRIKVFGVRKAESARRKHLWREVAFDKRKYRAVCAIVFWSDEDVWDFIRGLGLAYCELYDEGFGRLGCVGCPLNPSSQKREFERWPHYRKMWHWAVTQNWHNHQGRLREDGNPYMHARFSTPEAFWEWWMNDKTPDVFREDCQSGVLWTNEDSMEDAA